MLVGVYSVEMDKTMKRSVQKYRNEVLSVIFLQEIMLLKPTKGFTLFTCTLERTLLKSSLKL